MHSSRIVGLNGAQSTRQARRLAEIDENLHRAELTALQRAEQIARWIELTATKIQSSQVATNESKRDDGRGHRQEGGVNAASRDLGITKDDRKSENQNANLRFDRGNAALPRRIDGAITARRPSPSARARPGA